MIISVYLNHLDNNFLKIMECDTVWLGQEKINIFVLETLETEFKKVK